MTDVGTLEGIALHETMATDGDEATTITNEAESELTSEMETSYGLDQVEGIVTADGVTVIKLETGTAIIAVEGMEAMAEMGTLFGTLVQATITADGLD
jgi:hypothetical protein